MANEEDTQTLKKKATIERWLQGKDVWNAWVEENPVYSVDFSGVDFSEYRNSGNRETISFKGFHFPKGNVNFTHAHFGDGDVIFSQAQFGEGGVNFSGAQFGDGGVYFSRTQFGDGDVDFPSAQFGDGDVHFSRAQFGEGNVYFFGAQFGKGDVNFSEAQFGDGNVYFSGAQFGKGDVNFSLAQFGEGGVHFSGAQFGEGGVHFSRAQFGEGGVNFSGAQFGEGNVYFSGAKFGEGNVKFSNAQFGEGDVNFSGAQFGEGAVYFIDAEFGKGKYLFERIKFEEQVFFSDLTNVEKVTAFSFKYSTFDNSLEISSKGVFGCIIDLTSTRMSHQVSLSDLKCTLKTKENTPKPRIFSIIDKLPKFLKNEKQNGEWLYNNIAEDEKDAERARRLKETTANNKNHQKSLDFHALEMQAERKPNPLPKSFHGFSKLILTFLFLAYAYIPVFLLMYHPISFFSYPPIYTIVFYFVIKHFPFLLVSEFWYQKCSDYGRSIIRPLTGLLVVFIIFIPIYVLFSENVFSYETLKASSLYSSSQMFSFIPSARDSRSVTSNVLFHKYANTDLMLFAFTSIQSILSITLLFLLSLGLKNKFRI